MLSAKVKAIVHFVQLFARTRHVPPRAMLTSSESCQECAHRWQASGYNPDVRCPRHEVG
ncbi:MAG: hypothetical protein ABW215_22535 [Kibdelosporangium sp.]